MRQVGGMSGVLREPQRERMRGPGQPREGGSRKGLTFLLSPERSQEAKLCEGEGGGKGHSRPRGSKGEGAEGSADPVMTGK